ncbi:MAG: alpha/beta hydrolase [Clostridia bacterium]|nr:alpha/beta hydrolase [Clostridia bacterium]
MREYKNIAYGNDTAQQLDIYLPDGEVKATFVYFHGGGLECGDKSCASIFAPYLTDRKIAVVSANYRMYPSNKYPDFIFDAAEAVAWTNKYIREELKCDKLYVGGSSAGGYLSMMICFDNKYLASVGLDNSVISGYFHDAGQPTAHFNVLKYSGVDPRRVIIDETSALYYVGFEKEYPKMRFVVSDKDMKGRYEQTMLMLSTLDHFGYKNFDHVVMHGFHCEYCEKLDEKCESIFGQMIFDFMK